MLNVERNKNLGGHKDVNGKSPKLIEKHIVQSLIDLGAIHEKFTGQLIIHFADGGIAQIDRLEKNLTKKFNCG